MPIAQSTLLFFQDRLLSLLGSSPEKRSLLVAGMLRRDATESTSYWFQLLVSVGIATLGLVVGSTAVVIGAMLVAPLMGPIIGLAMGFASGSPYLVLRSTVRIGGSLLVAILGAMAITFFLPFYELNAEISARTSPTALDLLTASFCALAGIYATLCAHSDAVTTASGTSISISLVPPLCASGYGLGTQSWSVAGGAFLLFLTNLAAIVVVGTIAFVATGFTQVNVLDLEREELTSSKKDHPLARAVARRLSGLFESKYGLYLRFSMPFILLAAVYIPLRRALDEVAWQVKARTTIQKAISAESLHVVENRVRFDHRDIDIAIVIVGKAEDAEGMKTRVESKIRAAGGSPRIDVLAVPDSNAFAGLESSLFSKRAAEAAETSEPKVQTLKEKLGSSTGLLREALIELWPKKSSGEIVAIDVGAEPESPLRIGLTHLGPPIGKETIETIERVIGQKFSLTIHLRSQAVSTEAFFRNQGDLAFIAKIGEGIRATVDLQGIVLCIRRPDLIATSLHLRPERKSKTDLSFEKLVEPLIASYPRVTTSTDSVWSAQFVHGECDFSAPEVKSSKE